MKQLTLNYYIMNALKMNLKNATNLKMLQTNPVKFKQMTK